MKNTDIKLHLGCGYKILENYINIDIQSKSKNIINDDVSVLTSILDETVDEIYACHVLEHFGRHEVKKVLKTWYLKLKSKGVLKISVPDIKAVFEHYQVNNDLKLLLGFLYGGQRDEYDYHKIGFDFLTIKQLLIDVGFIDIHIYDWKKTEHSHIDDYSQAYLPHMDKDNGKLMSLNIQATKP